MRGRLLVAVTLCARVAWAVDAQAPKLEAQPLPSGRAEEEAAQPLPTAVVICVHRGEHRCWSAGSRDCAATGGEIFAVVAAGGAEGEQLRACWEDLGR